MPPWPITFRKILQNTKKSFPWYLCFTQDSDSHLIKLFFLQKKKQTQFIKQEQKH